jgi:phosphatidate cytidylyltransferase
VAVVGGPLVLAAVWAGGTVLAGVLAAAAAVGSVEFYRMAEARGEEPFLVPGAGASAGLVLMTLLSPTPGAWAGGVVAVLLGLAALCMALSLRLRWPDGRPAGAVGATLTGVVYVGLPISTIPFLRGVTSAIPGLEDRGPWVPMAFVLFPLLITWASDSAAYFVGNLVGRRRLAPSVSPGKSVEGAVGGILGAVGAGVLMSNWWLSSLPVLAVAPATAAWMAAVISVMGQIGDLVESVLKREAGVKDSGKLLPGHGGLLDRLDALLWAFPAMWAMLLLGAAT